MSVMTCYGGAGEFGRTGAFLIELPSQKGIQLTMAAFMGPNTPEAELIDACIEGQGQAFRELVRRYESVVAATVVGMLGRSSDVDDVGQEVMIRLYKALPRFRRDSSLKTFITRIAINLCLDTLRQRKRKAWQFWRSDDDQDGMDMVPDAKELGMDVEIKQSVNRALAALSVDYRSVALLRLVQGYSTEETAAMLGIPAGTVLSRLSRAKTQLKKELADYVG